METGINKFAQIGDIYSQFTEKNKNRLIRTARSLLKIQRLGEEMIGYTLPPAGKNTKKDEKVLLKENI